jgi:deoxyadenosine/deoxycytidine kinase
MIIPDQTFGFKSENPMRRKYASALRGKILVLEGIISAGKSTAGHELKKFCDSIEVPCKFFPEPLCAPLLSLFLKDNKKYAFAFQLAMLIQRKALYIQAQEYAQKGYFCIIDRSLHGDYCFAKMHLNRGNICQDEWDTYIELLNTDQNLSPDYVLYLKVTAQVAISRCAIRDRKGESAYDLEYYNDLCNIYDIVIECSPRHAMKSVDWNEDRRNVEIAPVLASHILEMYNTI